MNIVLIGYRGSGKTSIGKLLASQLWKQFRDVDRIACQRIGIDSIAEIWQRFGEPHWRKTEVEVTQELCRGDDQVIALGGGTLMQQGAYDAVKAAKAIRIYLRCEARELLRRVSGDNQSAAARPNLTNLGGGLEEIQEMIRRREPVYLDIADKVLDVTHLSIPDATRYLIEKCL